MTVIVHHACHQLANAPAKELLAIGARPVKAGALFEDRFDVQLQTHLLPGRERFSGFLDDAAQAFADGRGAALAADELQFHLSGFGFHGSAFLLIGPEDSEPCVKLAVLLTLVVPPAVVPVSSSPDARIHGTKGERFKGWVCNFRVYAGVPEACRAFRANAERHVDTEGPERCRTRRTCGNYGYPLKLLTCRVSCSE